MNNYQHFQFLKKSGFFSQTEEEHLRLMVNDLLQCLYKPKNRGFVPDWGKIKRYGINHEEPVNWADLSSSIEKKGDCFIVTIEEASPGDCSTLCEYIDKWLTVWGWCVEVETEW